jgi:hypothetical protein
LSREQGKVITIDAREAAPIQATRDMFVKKPGLSQKGKKEKQQKIVPKFI